MEFKDPIPAAGGKIEFLVDGQGRISLQISGLSNEPGFHAFYQVAVSLDGRHVIDEVPATGLGQSPIYRQPSVVVYIQSDGLGFWGRNCPRCKRYFRTNHVMGPAVCPYCAIEASSLMFLSEKQKEYITHFYDGFARAYLTKKSTTLDVSAITDVTPAWHFAEEKQQRHVKCQTDKCKTQFDILGNLGFCPKCGQTNASDAIKHSFSKRRAEIVDTNTSNVDRDSAKTTFERISISLVTEFEALGKHLRRKLLLIPLTAKRRKKLEGISFQRIAEANEILEEIFGLGFFETPTGNSGSTNQLSDDEKQFINLMLQKRHVLIHNGGIADEAFIMKSKDTTTRIDERIEVKAWEAERFLRLIEQISSNFIENVERGFLEAE